MVEHADTRCAREVWLSGGPLLSRCDVHEPNPCPTDTAENGAPVGLVRVDSWKVVCYECRDEYEDWNGWSIFGDHGHAWESASESDWLVREGLVLCPSCWSKRPYCRDEDEKCLRRDVTEAEDGWKYCPEHIEQGMYETRVLPPGSGDTEGSPS